MNKQIAGDLHTVERTIKAHRANLMAKRRFTPWPNSPTSRMRPALLARRPVFSNQCSVIGVQ